MQKTFIAFANSDGGDLYIGIEDKKVSTDRLIGFAKIEDANDIIHTLLEETQPSIENMLVEFIDFEHDGYVLHFSIPKSPKVHYSAQSKCYIRINARKMEIKGERIIELSYSKGVSQYEKHAVDSIEIEDILNSDFLAYYMERIGSELDNTNFLRKQRLLTKKDEKYFVNVGGVLLFDNEPQASLDTRCAIKVYRLRTTAREYDRNQLETMPFTINGPIEKQIVDSLQKIDEILHNVSYSVGGKLVKLEYPSEAIKELVVNAVIHRDYSIHDDIHIRIYDNRIEIQSPGRLPGFITTENIYDERYSRNPNIVRMLHNLPDPVNYDIGEGLNTARNELRKVGLVEPEIKELNNAVLIIIKHEKIATLEDIIMEYLNNNPGASIANRDVRGLSGENDVNKIKKAFQNLRKQGYIVPENADAKAFDYRYILK